MYPEDELLPISGLQHLRFCERRWSLVHLEQQWEENRFTSEGGVLHERVHDGGIEARPGIVVARGLYLWSRRLGLGGIADVVEYHRDDSGVALAGRPGTWRPYPVEYKRGQRKWEPSHMVQLCAQAMCLEEMLSVEISAGAVFHGVTRRRTEVRFDTALRGETEALARRMHELNRARVTPPAAYSKKCESCSLYDRCLPRAVSKDVERYWARALREMDPV
ncbi:MAG: CRISPR-associated protein Cas4 [Bryobacterales bacterium]|nr:CRISPR-associated protein Cas4 [Bryobacterales bacterium]